MNRSYEKSLRILLISIGLLLLCAAFYQVWVQCYNPYLHMPFFRRGNYMLTIMYGAVLLLCVLSLKGHTLGEARLTEVIAAQCISVLMTAVIVYFPMSLLQYELLEFRPLLLLVPGQWLLVAAWNLLANRIYFKLVPPLRMLLVCDSHSRGGREIAKKLNGIPEKYDICGQIGTEDGEDAVRERLRDYDAALLLVKDEEQKRRLVQMCFHQNIQLFLAPTLTDVIVNRAKVTHSVDTPLLRSTAHHLTLEGRAVKRGMDLLGAAAGLVITSPLLLLAALAIKAGDGGPVFFRQERLTRDGKVFRIYKFRSMVTDAEREGQRLAAENDRRVTGVGRILRKTRIDELPQLFNVLRGDMSLVGPRPECPAIAAEYEKTLPEFSCRLKMKAGITGYAQIYGNYTTSPADKLLMDIMYIERSNALLDINLLLLTLRTLLMTDKTRGLPVNRREGDEL
ncbi:MAG: exopolysaccharide biosynthesis polyprenyl glycosylphosphotransferase [Bacillota bacterium]|nr:exopolysaccharide biosynthesis polyprenyl glycosylphosphotransferase [Bacillota bacterium]